MKRIEEFIPTNFGWISRKTPPTNNNDVVVLIWLTDEELFVEDIGFYEANEWHLRDYDNDSFEVKGWFPYPYTPHNSWGECNKLECGNKNPPCAPNLKFGMLECTECDWGE